MAAAVTRRHSSKSEVTPPATRLNQPVVRWYSKRAVRANIAARRIAGQQRLLHPHLRYERTFRPARATSDFVKVCGCRPHEGGATHTGAGVRKPPKEETAGGRERWSVRSYGNLVAGALLPKCIERVFGKRSRGQRTRSTDRDMQNRRCASEIEREDGCP